jgi:hypothetical protein
MTQFQTTRGTTIYVDLSLVHADVQQLMRDHRMGTGIVHDNLQSSRCSCKRGMVGEVCIECGGVMVRTGTCSTCVECGATGGCG